MLALLGGLAALRATSNSSAPEDFCFPPFSRVTLRIAGLSTNSSALTTETIFIAPNALRATVTVSPTPFGGDAPAPYPVNILNDDAARASWQWYRAPGAPAVTCNKSPLSPADSSSICIGGDLSLNSTRVVGGRVASSWVGFSDEPEKDGACWHELLIASPESADPAAWVSVTSQCEKAAAGKLPRSASVQTLQFSDFSIAPFPPGTFDLPKECPK